MEGNLKKYRVFLSDEMELALFKSALEFDGLVEGGNIKIEYIDNGGYYYAEIVLLDEKIGICDLNTAFCLSGPLSRWKNELIEVKPISGCRSI